MNHVTKKCGLFVKTDLKFFLILGCRKLSQFSGIHSEALGHHNSFNPCPARPGYIWF